jgi:hypothetical protein
VAIRRTDEIKLFQGRSEFGKCFSGKLDGTVGKGIFSLFFLSNFHLVRRSQDSRRKPGVRVGHSYVFILPASQSELVSRLVGTGNGNLVSFQTAKGHRPDLDGAADPWNLPAFIDRTGDVFRKSTLDPHHQRRIHFEESPAYRRRTPHRRQFETSSEINSLRKNYHLSADFSVLDHSAAGRFSAHYLNDRARDIG